MQARDGRRVSFEFGLLPACTAMVVRAEEILSHCDGLHWSHWGRSLVESITGLAHCFASPPVKFAIPYPSGLTGREAQVQVAEELQFLTNLLGKPQLEHSTP